MDTNMHRKAQLCLCLHETFVSTRWAPHKKQSHHMFLLFDSRLCWCCRLVRHCRLLPFWHCSIPSERSSSGADNALHIIASMNPFTPHFLRHSHNTDVALRTLHWASSLPFKARKNRQFVWWTSSQPPGNVLYRLTLAQVGTSAAYIEIVAFTQQRAQELSGFWCGRCAQRTFHHRAKLKGQRTRNVTSVQCRWGIDSCHTLRSGDLLFGIIGCKLNQIYMTHNVRWRGFSYTISGWDVR